MDKNYKDIDMDPFGLDYVCDDGLYMCNYEGTVPRFDYSLRKLAQYARERNITEITDEVINQAKKEGAI